MNIIQIALTYPSIFAPFVSHFLVGVSDSRHIWKLKLELITLTFPYTTNHNRSIILAELSHLIAGYDKDLVKESVKAIGRCAQMQPKSATRCLNLLMTQVLASEVGPVADSLTVIRHIIQQNAAMHKKTVIRLAKSLDTLTHPAARASIIWLVGEFAGVDHGDNIAADVLRILAKGFCDEAEVSKLQIVLLAAKVYSHHLNQTQHAGESDKPKEPEELQLEESHPIALLFQYVMRLARYDTSYDLRDRTRLYLSMLSTTSSIQLATLVLLAPKPTPYAPSPFASSLEGLTLGSSSLVVGKSNYVRGYEPLPDWATEATATSSKIRDQITPGEELMASTEKNRVPAVVAPSEKSITKVDGGRQINQSKATPKKVEKEGKTLDQWLESSSEEDGESEEEDDDDDSSSEYEEDVESSGDDEEDDSDEEESEEDEATDDEEEQKKGIKPLLG